MSDRLHSCHVILHFYNKYKVWMLSNDDLILTTSLGSCNIINTRYCTALFTSTMSNSIVQGLMFGDIDSAFLNAAFKAAII